jgi:hypothetical protein
MTAWSGRLPVRPHLRPKPMRFPPCTSWATCTQLAELMHVEPEALWASLRRLTIHVRDAASDDFAYAAIDLADAIALPTEGQA